VLRVGRGPRAPRGDELDRIRARTACAGGREVTDPAVRWVVHDQVLAERGGTVWPSFPEDVVFELGIGRCLLMLTQAGNGFAQGPTLWKAGTAAGS
jgi:hypothetical protein